jgi:hypothetical protein
MSETILAIIAACAIIAAILMAGLAYRMNEAFTYYSRALASIFSLQAELFEKVMKLKAEEKNEQD